MTVGDIAGQKRGVNLLATGVFTMIPQQAAGPGELESLFFPLFAYAVLRTKVGGAVTLAARIRVGGNGSHDDVMPLFVVPAGAQVGAFAMPTLVAQPFVPPDLRAGPISFEIERAAVGPTELTGDIMVVGTMVSG